MRRPSRTDFWNSGFTRRCLLSMHSEEATMTFGPPSLFVSASRSVSRILPTSYVRSMCRTHLTPTPFTAWTMVLLIERARGHDVLAAGRRRIEIIDDHDHAVVLVVDGVADRGGKPVVPEAAVAH